LLAATDKFLSNVQRTKVESKSQPSAAWGGIFISCYQMYKEQKLKANHNGMIVPEDIRLLLSNVQRTKVESK
jgi:hypothetical protein